MQIKLVDNNFTDNVTGTTSPVHKSSNIQWLRTIDNTDTVVLTDVCLHLHEHYPVKNKIAWMLEPSVILPSIYSYIKDNYHHFTKILTHSKEVASKIPNAEYCPFGTSWIKDEDWKTHEKTKTLSIIASSKANTIGQRLRHKIIQYSSPSMMDSFGRGYKPLADKIDGLKDYRFSFAIENCQEDDYFSEKLIDCFATRTVPIYFGTKNIGKYFDLNGMILVNNLEEALDSISSLTEETYNSMKDSININFSRASQYKTAEDSLFPLLPKAQTLD